MRSRKGGRSFGGLSLALQRVVDRKRSIAEEVERYVRTGETDPHHAAWPGSGFMVRANRSHDDLRGALVREVRRRARGLAHEPLPQADTVALTRDKVEPMVCGLFARGEQGYDHSARTLANLYLASGG